MNIEFRRAHTDQSEILSDLAIESKGHWGYSQEQLDLWRKDLQVPANYIENHFVETIHADGQLVGFYALTSENQETTLDHLWLLPKAIGNGLGRQIFSRVMEQCIALRIQKFVIISDPDAEGFYLRMGAKRIGEVESIPQNRMLPKLLFEVTKHDSGLSDLQIQGFPLTACQEDDFDLLAELRLRAMRESLEALGRFNRQRSIERFRSSFAPNSTWILRKDGAPIAFLTLTEQSGHLRLDHLYVDPLHQSSGIGSALITLATSRADKENTPIRLQALRGSQANKFYHRHGFSVTEEEPWDIHYERSPRP